MFKNIYKIAFILQLLVSINTVNAMNNSQIEANNLKQSQSNNNKQVLQNNINSNFVEVSEEEQCGIFMNLYCYPMDEWKNVYHKYSFENDRIAYDKKYSCDECINDTYNLSQTK